MPTFFPAKRGPDVMAPAEAGTNLRELQQLEPYHHRQDCLVLHSFVAVRRHIFSMSCAITLPWASRSIFMRLDVRIASRITDSSNLRKISMFGMTQWPPMTPGKYFTEGKNFISS